MFKVFEFILSFFSAGMKQKIMAAIQEKLLGKSGDGGSDDSPLGSLMKQFQEKGLGNIFNSWVGAGKNQAISPEEVQAGVGAEKMQEMSQKTGLSVSDLAKELSKYLPTVIDKMTPNGKLPGK
ncbi:YidB family protein [Limnoglobus roseus]|uniref:DUF937 domain-containing protein n=1 Tax=Limnoglobus roseus TaxID=2598579 RepID=A0A5C1AMC9_9BACT|nr:YidB family protein [Limnoglobus roseus]QEL18058.1 hypothetical protein PX52LOC_05072 [Limnoglobus roseus]